MKVKFVTDLVFIDDVSLKLLVPTGVQILVGYPLPYIDPLES